MDECCRKGFRWEGTPTGREDKLGDRRAYITGTDAKRAVLLVHDGFGWDWNNTRLLADHYAQEIGATVYLPDYFDDFRLTEKDISIRRSETGSVIIEQNKDFDWAGWTAKNGVDARLGDVIASARVLRTQYARLGAVGYCWGGLVGFKLASKALDGLFDCISIAHPASPSPENIREVGVPFQVLACEHDPTFGRELQELCNSEIPKLGVPYHYQYFPGMVHGICTKCDMKNEKEKAALELAKDAVVFWLKAHL